MCVCVCVCVCVYSRTSTLQNYPERNKPFWRPKLQKQKRNLS